MIISERFPGALILHKTNEASRGKPSGYRSKLNKLISPLSNGKTITSRFMAGPFDPIFRLPACPQDRQVKKPRRCYGIVLSQPIHKRFIRFANSCLILNQNSLAKMRNLLFDHYLIDKKKY